MSIPEEYFRTNGSESLCLSCIIVTSIAGTCSMDTSRTNFLCSTSAFESSTNFLAHSQMIYGSTATISVWSPLSLSHLSLTFIETSSLMTQSTLCSSSKANGFTWSNIELQLRKTKKYSSEQNAHVRAKSLLEAILVRCACVMCTSALSPARTENVPRVLGKNSHSKLNSNTFKLPAPFMTFVLLC